ncbi:MAG TPA: PilW family protein [Candidatus Wunengus sp. YC63]|uniref:PilW family protein n=1 Tax=unclassified Candidatus Wunengus TaxID=3367695 RepID=UPI0040282B0E
MKIFRHKPKIGTFLLRLVQTNTCSSFQETRVKRQRGFTLVELVIVIALMAILWGVAYTMFYQSKKVFSLSDNKLGTYQYARIAMDEISRDLKGATITDNVDYFRSFTNGPADAKNNNSVLTFLSLTPNGSSTPVTLITYYLKNTDELMRAEYNDTSYIYGTVPASIDPSQFTYYKLTANTNYFNLAYVTGSASVSAWDSTSGTTTGHLPDAVSVTIQIYGTGTGNALETGTFTTQITIPYRITH